ncbi:MAG: recombinase family protein [Victivallales bacterium]
MKDGTNIFDKLFQQGRGFVSATENLDFSSPAGRAMLGMMQVFNQFEREQSEKIPVIR